MPELNRQQRRAAERRKVTHQLAGFQFLLTPDEAPLLEEALHDYTHALAELSERSEAQEWAMLRSERIRAAVAAAIEGRPYLDISPQRWAPDAAPGTRASALG